MDSCGYSDDAIRKMKISLTELIVNAILQATKRILQKSDNGHFVINPKLLFLLWMKVLVLIQMLYLIPRCLKI
jgi:hypothetical protein